MAGVTSVSLDISILDDDVIEDNENFTLTINIDSLPDGIITSSPSKVTVIIRNDDSKCYNTYYYLMRNIYIVIISNMRAEKIIKFIMFLFSCSRVYNS